MERNSCGEIVYTDEWGEEYVLDEQGHKRTPMVTKKSVDNSGFTTYDSSHGHCCFCGRLTCNGTCFK